MINYFEAIVKRLYKIFLFKKIINFLFINFRFLIWKHRKKIHGINKNELFFAQYVKKKIRIKKFSLLEIGCGEGNLIKYLSNYFPFSKLVGYDLNDFGINDAKKNRIKNAKFYVKDINDVKKIRGFDFIVSKASLIYLSETEMEKFLKTLSMSNFKKCFFLELGTNNKNCKKTSFFAHNYSNLLKEISRNNKITYNIKVKPKLKAKWYTKNSQIFPVLVEISKK